MHVSILDRRNSQVLVYTTYDRLDNTNTSHLFLSPCYNKIRIVSLFQIQALGIYVDRNVINWLDSLADELNLMHRKTQIR